jgi:hypothetical protein
MATTGRSNLINMLTLPSAAVVTPAVALEISAGGAALVQLR